MPPPVPVIVIVLVPALAVELAVNFSVDEPVPGEAMEVGEKVAVTPRGRVLTLREIDELKPLTAAVLTVVLAELLGATVTVVGLALMVKFAGLVVTVRETVVVAVILLLPLPLVPVMVTVFVPVVAVAEAVNFRVVLPLPVTVVGL